MSYTMKLKTTDFQYNISNNIWERQETICDLGVIFDAKLTFITHIDNIVSSAYKSLEFVIQNTKGMDDLDALKMLYYSFVRSQLEYASVVWSPVYDVHINRLEKIQRRFLKYTAFLIWWCVSLSGLSSRNFTTKIWLTKSARETSHRFHFISLFNCNYQY